MSNDEEQKVLKGSTSKSYYCRVGSCDNLPNHDGEHRCRCGKLVFEDSPGCQWHQSPPPSVTADQLLQSLHWLSDKCKLEAHTLMVGDRPVVNVHIHEGRVVLETFEAFLLRAAKEKEDGR